MGYSLPHVARPRGKDSDFLKNVTGARRNSVYEFTRPRKFTLRIAISGVSSLPLWRTARFVFADKRTE